MKSEILAILGILAVVALSGCTQQTNANVNATQNATLVRLSQDNFYYMGMSWENNQNHNYESNPNWCIGTTYFSDGLDLKYKLVDISQDYHNSITCKIYDGSALIYDYMKENKGFPMIKVNGNDPEDIRTITVGLSFNQNHNLNICCYVYGPSYSGSDQFKPISNEVCFTKQVDKVKCDKLGY